MPSLSRLYADFDRKQMMGADVDDDDDYYVPQDDDACTPRCRLICRVISIKISAYFRPIYNASARQIAAMLIA